MLDGLSIGEELLRRELHKRYGGRQQGGIGPSSRTKSVLFFTDPDKGHQHGYYDGMGEDGFFHYVGEGQRGDQQLTQGNKSILNHRTDGRTLEGFRSQGTSVTYLGQFDLVDHYFTDAHETGDPTTLRQVVVFKLRALNELPVPLLSLPVSPPETTALVEIVPVEERHTERALVTPNQEPREMERRESDLVRKYRQHLIRQGHTVNRLRVVPPGESLPLYSDLWDETATELIEAKGTVTRESLRTAVGQLFDYGRFVEAESLTVLVPSKPRPDLVNYLHRTDIAVVFPHGEEWIRIQPPASKPRPGHTHP